MRDDEPLDDIPSVAPERDEIASYQQTRAGKTTSKSSGGSGGFLLFLAFLLALAAAVAAGYLYQELLKSTAALADATDRISSLEDRLSSTDESVSESAAVQAVKIKELGAQADKAMSEIDKLWASAWRKNKATLEEQGKQLASQSSRLGSMQNGVDSLQASIERVEAELQKAQQQAQLVKEVQASSIAQNAQLSELNDAVAALKVSAGGLQKKVGENEEWVQSFNSFRRQINSKLNQLEDSIIQRTSQPSPLPPG